MSIRLSFVNLYLKLFVRRALVHMKTPADARRHLERSAARLPVSLRDLNISADSVDGRGGAIPVEWISQGRARRDAIVIYLHGGAHIMGSPRTHRSITTRLARLTGARVMVPDFRLAPEHPAPAAVDDAVAAYTALLTAGYDASRIALSGESSGGGMCFAVLLELERLGYPQPACVAAFSPWVDLTMTSDSVRENAGREVMLPVARSGEVIGYYLGAEGERKNPMVSPLFGAFSAPPPTLIQASRAEILLDDATRMADHLRMAGGEVEIELWDTTPHAWQFFAPILPEGRDAMAKAGAFIRAHIGV